MEAHLRIILTHVPDMEAHLWIILTHVPDMQAHLRIILTNVPDMHAHSMDHHPIGQRITLHNNGKQDNVQLVTQTFLESICTLSKKF